MLRVVVSIRAGLSVCLAVPRVLVAGGDIVGCIAVITDCKMESIGTGATLFVGVIEGVDARGVIFVLMPVI